MQGPLTVQTCEKEGKRNNRGIGVRQSQCTSLEGWLCAVHTWARDEKKCWMGDFLRMHGGSLFFCHIYSSISFQIGKKMYKHAQQKRAKQK